MKLSDKLKPVEQDFHRITYKDFPLSEIITQLLESGRTVLQKEAEKYSFSHKNTSFGKGFYSENTIYSDRIVSVLDGDNFVLQFKRNLEISEKYSRHKRLKRKRLDRITKRFDVYFTLWELVEEVSKSDRFSSSNIHINKGEKLIPSTGLIVTNIPYTRCYHWGSINGNELMDNKEGPFMFENYGKSKKDIKKTIEEPYNLRGMGNSVYPHYLITGKLCRLFDGTLKNLK